MDDKVLEELWEQLGDVPFDEAENKEMILAEPFHIFEKGTEREEIAQDEGE